MIKNEVKKELLRSKVNAQFSHYAIGKLYYNVDLVDGKYQFPLSVIEEGETYNPDESGLSMYEVETVVLSKDIGTTYFHNVMRGSELNRWIDKAIDKGEFIKIN